MQMPFRMAHECTRVAALGLSLLYSANLSVAAEDYFKGKTISIYTGASAGDGYDVYARLLSVHYQRYIPGNPTIVIRNMPGAGSLKAANYIYEIAPKDGTAIGTVGGGTATAELFKSKGVRFDPRYYAWIGSMNAEVGLVLAWKTVPVDRIHDLFNRELVVGGGGPTSGNVVFANVMNKVLGTRFKLIAGYKSTGDIALAIERGELEGTASYHYSSIITSKPDWITNGQVKVLLQDSLRPHSLFPDVPVVIDLARTAEQKDILEVVFARQEMGRPFMLPPGTPAELVTLLRRTFDAAMRDPQLVSDAKRQRLDLNRPMSGEDIHGLIDRLYTFPADIVAKAAEATGENAAEGSAD
jgi:tripartite-type tricarboxylate transporter receptor subunit TctC